MELPLPTTDHDCSVDTIREEGDMSELTVEQGEEFPDITSEQIEEVQRRLNELCKADDSEPESCGSDSEYDGNEQYRPFRNEDSRMHVNRHRTRACSTSSMVSTVVFDAKLVKGKVASQLKQKRMKQVARRTRKQGEASLGTAQRREVANDVKTSLSAVWHGDC